MVVPVFKINNVEVNPPNNWRELQLELNFDTDNPDFRGQVSTTRWTIGLGDQNKVDGAVESNNWIDGGLTLSTPGALEGVSFSIDLRANGTTDNVFDGYLNLAEADIRCDQIIAEAVEQGGIDWFNQRADNITFQGLWNLKNNAKGKLYDSDVVPVEYVLSSVPDIYGIAITGMAIYTVVNNFIMQIEIMVEKIPEFIIPNFGNIVSIILAIINLILLTIASVVLTIQLYRQLVPKVKYHAGMYVTTQLERACEYLGLEFQSTILQTYPYNKLLILPETYSQFEKDDGATGVEKIVNFAASLLGIFELVNFDETGFYRGTFGDLLRELKKMFNAKVIIQDGVLKFERIDTPDTLQPAYTLPDISRKELFYQLNSDEFHPNYKISFSRDQSDKNIIQDYIGTEVELITEPKIIANEANQIGGTNKDINLQFARGKRRTKKNFLEKMFGGIVDRMKDQLTTNERLSNEVDDRGRKLLAPVNKQISQLSTLGVKTNKPGVPPTPPIEISKYANDLDELLFRKKNVLLLEQDVVEVPKMLIMQADYDKTDDEVFNRLDVNNDTFVSAKFLYQNYHFINSFVGNEHNQHKVYEFPEIPFTFEHYQQVKNDNIVFDSDGVTRATIISLKWNPFTSTATNVKFKVNEKWTDNLKERIVEYDGK